MATVFLDPNDTFTLASDAVVVGSTGDETVLLQGSVEATSLDADIERVEFAGNAGDFQFLTVGTSVEVFDSNGNQVATFNDVSNSPEVVFQDGATNLSAPSTVGGSAQLGGTAIPAGSSGDATAAQPVAPGTIDGTDTSSVSTGAGGGGGGGAGGTFTLTANRDIPSLTSGDDTITADPGTFDDNDVISDNSSSDNDTVTINETNDQTGSGVATNLDGKSDEDDIPDGLITGVENTVINLENFDEQQVGAANITGGTLTLNQVQNSGAASTTVARVGAGLDIVAGDGITGTLTVDLDQSADVSGLTIDAVNADTVTVADVDSDGVSITANDSGSIDGTTNATVNLEGTAQTDDTATVSGVGDVDLDAKADTSALTNLDGSVQNSGDQNSLVENLTLSGNGGAVAFNADDGGAPTTVTATGDQDVTYENAFGDLDGNTINNNLTSGTFTVIASGTAAGLDLTNADADVFEIAANNSGQMTTVEDGDTVRLTADQTATHTISAGSAGDNTLNLEVQTVGSSPDTASLTITDADFGTVNLTADNGDNSSDTITMNGTVFGSGTTVDVSGSDNLEFSGTTTANAVDAADFTGVLTAALSASLNTVTGGSADDVFTDVGAGAAATIIGNGGDDAFTLGGAMGADITGGAGDDTVNFAAIGASDLTFDGGAGTDEVTFNPGGSLDLSGKTFDLTGVETLDLNPTSAIANTLTLAGSQIDGTSLVVTSTDTTQLDSLDVAADAASLDLSNLTVNTSAIDNVTTDLTSVASIDTTITGSNAVDDLTGQGNGNITFDGLGGADTLTGAGGADDFSGGAGNDMLEGAAGSDVIDGGAGDDDITFLSENGASDTLTGGTGQDDFIQDMAGVVTAPQATEITDFTVSEDDNLDLSITALNGVQADGSDTATLKDGNAAAIVGTNNLSIKSLSSDDETLAGGDQLMFLEGIEVADTTELLSAIATDGSRTFDLNSAATDNDGILIGYDTGSAINIALAQFGSGSTDSDTIDGAKDIVELTGVSPSEFVNGDFDTIA